MTNLIEESRGWMHGTACGERPCGNQRAPHFEGFSVAEFVPDFDALHVERISQPVRCYY